MYYLDEIMDRTFDRWGSILGANDNSFWTVISTIETKPTTETETVTTPSTPAETPAWEPADVTETQEYQETNSQDTSTQEDSTFNSNPMSETIEQIADAAKDMFNEINPFTDEEPENR